MPKGEGTRAWRKSGRQREGAKIADPQDLEGLVKAVLLESQFPVGPIMTHRQSASRRCCPCQRLLRTAIRTSEGKTGDNASSQRNERDTSTILIRTTWPSRSNEQIFYGKQEDPRAPKEHKMPYHAKKQCVV